MIISSINPKNLGEIQGEYADIDGLQTLSELITQEHWSPTTFSGTKRRLDLAQSCSLLVLDIDEGCTLEEAKLLFKDYKHIIATTRNHQKVKNGLIADRFRVILELDKAITSDDDFKATFFKAKALFPFIDEACKDISRFFYPCRDIVSVSETGQSFGSVKAEPIKTLGAPLVQPPLVPLPRGVLSKATLQFLLEGAPVGQRHAALVKACIDFKEQGYTEAEALERIQDMADRKDSAFVDKSSLATIKDIFENRVVKYEAREATPAEESVYVGASELLTETFDYLSNKDLVTGDPTGLEGLDKMLGGGFREGELTVLMAQAKTGKNTLYHFLIHTMLKKGIKIGYASRELDPAIEVIPNLLTIELGKNLWKEEITDKIKVKAKEAISNWPLFFAPGYGHFPVEKIRNWVDALAKLGVKHFWMDHFHYMLTDEDYNNVSKLIKEIKTLTKQYKVHINLIVQPKNLQFGQSLSMDALKGGSSINQALDNLLILERVKNEKFVSRLKLEVARHKLAQLGEIFMQYDPTTTSFTEVDSLIVDVDPAPEAIREFNSKPYVRTGFQNLPKLRS